MSLIPYLIITKRSIPIPNAIPDFTLTPAAAITLGANIPLPNTSIHPVFLQTGHPLPPQYGQAISASIDGSVNGKNDKRYLIFTLSP